MKAALSLAITALILPSVHAAGPAGKSGQPVPLEVAAGWRASVIVYFNSPAPPAAEFLSKTLGQLGRVDVKDPAVRGSLEPLVQELRKAAASILLELMDYRLRPNPAPFPSLLARRRLLAERSAVLSVFFKDFFAPEELSRIQNFAAPHSYGLSDEDVEKLESRMTRMARALDQTLLMDTLDAVAAVAASAGGTDMPASWRLLPAHNKQTPLVYEPMAGERINETIAAIISLANERQRPIAAVFNHVALTANPGDSQETVRKPWYEAYESPAALARYEAAQAEWKRKLEIKRANNVAAIKALTSTPARTGTALIAAIKAEAKAKGWGAWDFYAVNTLNHPAEIAEFVRHYLKEYPKVAAENIRFVAQDRDHDGTKDFWLAALDAALREKQGQ